MKSLESHKLNLVTMKQLNQQKLHNRSIEVKKRCNNLLSTSNSNYPTLALTSPPTVHL